MTEAAEGAARESSPHSTAVPATITAPEERAAYERAARWAGSRQRQAVYDHATVVEAYFLGYLDGMRADVEGRAVTLAPSPCGASAAVEADTLADAPPLTPDLTLRAHQEGDADGRRWRERGKLGGLVRLAIYQSGKSARRFATEDLVRDHDKVRRWQTYRSNVPEVAADELLRRLHALRADTA